MTPTDPRNAGKGRHHEQDAVVHHYTEAELHNPDVAHEATDIDIRAVLLFAVGLAIVTVVSASSCGACSGSSRTARLRATQGVAARAAGAGMPRHTQSPFRRRAATQLLTNEPAALRKFRTARSQALEGTAGSTRTRRRAHPDRGSEEAAPRSADSGAQRRSPCDAVAGHARARVRRVVSAAGTDPGRSS